MPIYYILIYDYLALCSTVWWKKPEISSRIFSGWCLTFSFHLCFLPPNGEGKRYSPPKKSIIQEKQQQTSHMNLWPAEVGKKLWMETVFCIGGVQQNYNLCGFNGRWVAPRWTSACSASPCDPWPVSHFLLIACVTYETGLGIFFLQLVCRHIRPRWRRRTGKAEASGKPSGRGRVVRCYQVPLAWGNNALSRWQALEKTTTAQLGVMSVWLTDSLPPYFNIFLHTHTHT